MTGRELDGTGAVDIGRPQRDRQSSPKLAASDAGRRTLAGIEATLGRSLAVALRGRR